MTVDRIKAGHLYAINNGGHPDIDTPEPYLCINIDRGPVFLHAPFLAESGNGPHDTTPHEDNARKWGWQMNPDHILGDWETHRHQRTNPWQTTHTWHNQTHTATLTVTDHPHDGWHLTIETTTNNPYIAYSHLRYLGLDKTTAQHITGITINTPEPEQGA